MVPNSLLGLIWSKLFANLESADDKNRHKWKTVKSHKTYTNAKRFQTIFQDHLI